MTAFVGYLIVFLAAVSFIWQFIAIQKSPRVHADALSSFGVFSIVCGGLLFEMDTFPGGLTSQVAFIALICAVVVFQVAASLRSKSVHRFYAAVFLPAIIATVLFFTNATMNFTMALSQSLGRSMAILSLVVIALIVTMSPLNLRDIGGLTVLALTFVFSLTPFASGSWRPCDQFKCGPFGSIYTGFTSSENTMSFLCGIGILCALMNYRQKLNLPAVALFLLVLYATESRTSQLAIASALLAWILAFLCARSIWANHELKARLHRRRLVISGFSILIGAVFIVGFKLLLHAQPTDFSNRGAVWIRGLAALGDQWTTGLGIDRWYVLQSVGLVPAHFPHSEYLLLLFAGGITAVIGLYVMLVLAIRRASMSQSTLGFAAAYVVFLAVLGMTELYWNPLAPDGNALAIVLIISVLANRTMDGSREEVPSQVEVVTKKPRFGSHTVVTNHRWP